MGIAQRSLIGAALLALGGCHVGSPGDTPAPAIAPARAVVALSDVINNIKCDMLAFEAGNPYLTTLGRSLGGTITVTIDRSHSSGAGISIGVPIVAGVKLSAGISKKSSADFGETLTIPFVMTYDAASTTSGCPDFGNATATPAIKGVSASGKPTTYHLNGPLLNLIELRRQIEAVYAGNPMIGFVGFDFDGTIVLVDDQRADLGLDVYFINPSVASAVSDSYKISYRIGTNWQRILKDGKYLDDEATGSTPPTVTSFTVPPPARAVAPRFGPRRARRGEPDDSRSFAAAPDYTIAAPVVVAPEAFTLDPANGSISERQASDYIHALSRARAAAPPPAPPP